MTALILSWCVLAFGLLGLAYALNHPGALRKRADGLIPWPALMLFGPYHAWSRFTIQWTRMRHPEAYHEILPGLFLGRHLHPHEAEHLCRNAGLTHVLDMTAELPETPILRTLPGYRALPLLDMTGPSPRQLHEALEHLDKAGPVYVHCAIGYGRSATIVAALLLQLDHAATPEEAVAAIRSKRPRVRLNERQYRSLQAFHQDLQGRRKTSPDPWERNP